MVQGAILYNGLSNLVILSQRVNSEVYCRVIQEELLSFTESNVEYTCIFQQDNAKGHRSAHTIDWPGDNDVYLLPQPAWSHDLNPTENVWDVLTRQVDKNQRQFSAFSDLENCILDCQSQLQTDLLHKLNGPVPECYTQAIEKQGKCTSRKLLLQSKAMLRFLILCFLVSNNGLIVQISELGRARGLHGLDTHCSFCWSEHV